MMNYIYSLMSSVILTNERKRFENCLKEGAESSDTTTLTQLKTSKKQL